MTHNELRKFSIENKKFYYDLHGKILIKCSDFLVVPVSFTEAEGAARMHGQRMSC